MSTPFERWMRSNYSGIAERSQSWARMESAYAEGQREMRERAAAAMKASQGYFIECSLCGEPPEECSCEERRRVLEEVETNLRALLVLGETK